MAKVRETGTLLYFRRECNWFNFFEKLFIDNLSQLKMHALISPEILLLKIYATDIFVYVYNDMYVHCSVASNSKKTYNLHRYPSIGEWSSKYGSRLKWYKLLKKMKLLKRMRHTYMYEKFFKLYC